MTGFVYFLRCGDFVKVGYSAKPKRRIAALNTGSPFENEVIAQLPGTLAHEQAVHRCIAHLRHRGEWFKFGPEVQEIIDQGLPQPDVLSRGMTLDGVKTLRDVRTRVFGFNVEQMASTFGVSQPTVSRWDNGKGEPSAPMALRILIEAQRRELALSAEKLLQVISSTASPVAIDLPQPASAA